MKPEPIEPFDHDLLREERALEILPDADAKLRVLKRLEPVIVAVAAPLAGATIATIAWRKALMLAAAMGLTGVAVGSTVTALVIQRPVITISPAVEEPTKPPPIVGTVPPVVTKPEEPPHARKPAPKTQTPSRSALAREQELLDTARTAIFNRKYDAALSTLGRHATEFSRGVLAEEREALAIQALGLSGRDDEARARAAAFRDDFAGSMLMPAVDAISPPSP